MFTGDGRGGSGDFLIAALAANGLASQPFSRDRDDGLTLTGVWITAAVRCAPPGNKPMREEIGACHDHLRAEVSALDKVRVLVALGRIAFDACLTLLAGQGVRTRPRPPFGHGEVFQPADGPALVASYHPSRQNTHTGRLTPAMLDDVFRTARRLGGA